MSNNDKKVQKTQMFLPNWPEPLDLRNAKSEVIATDHYQILLECAKGRKNRPFHGLFQVVIKTSHRISINTTGKSALKLGNLQSLRWGRGHELTFHHVHFTLVCKISRVCGAIPSFVINHLFIVATWLILRRCFLRC